MSAFVDTSAFYALFVTEDAHHPAAVSCFEQLRFGNMPLVSTNYVLLECASLVQRRQGFEAARMVLAKTAELTDVIWIDQEAHDEGAALWAKTGSRAVSLVDCTSFSVMRARGIRSAVTFDAQFAQAGFEVLPESDRVSEPRGTYRVKAHKNAHAKAH